MREKRPDEIIKLRFNFERLLESVWQPRKEYTSGDYVRPISRGGFEYEATHTGVKQSDSREPKWPTTITDTVADGSCVWTCRDFGTSATDDINTRTVTADTGLTVDSSSISGRTVIVFLSGGELRGQYDVVCQIVTVAGETLELVEQIKVVDKFSNQ